MEKGKLFRHFLECCLLSLVPIGPLNTNEWRSEQEIKCLKRKVFQKLELWFTIIEREKNRNYFLK